MSEQVKRYWPEEIVGTGELVVYAQDYDALQSRIDAEQAGAAKLATKCVTLVNEAAYLRQKLSERNAVLRETADSLRCSKVFPALLESIDALHAEAEALRGNGWIPVNERLPSMVQEVIVNSEFDGVTAGILDSYGEWYSPNSDYKLTRVVAWQPLPAAPSFLATHRARG